MKKLGYFTLVLVLLSATLVACGGEEATSRRRLLRPRR